jgi:3'(2'), 5'-bisphosphate nucleotidase
VSRPHERERQVAIDAVRRASAVCRQVQANLVTAETLEKKDRSPVTVADFASQAIVGSVLAEAFPDDPLVGEEEAAELRSEQRERERGLVVGHVVRGLGIEADPETVLSWIDRGAGPCPPSGRFWTVDPIDGTKGFLRGEQYAVALALIEDGQVVLGLLGCPNLEDGRGGMGALLVASRGHGAFGLPLGSGGEELPVHVRGITDPAQARLTESVEAGHSDHDKASLIARRLGVTQPGVRMDSQAKYAAVARGDADVYLRLPTRPGYREKIWDHAAGSLVVMEAGATVSDVDGRPLDFSRGRTLDGNRGVVVAPAAIHQTVLDAVRGAGV